MPRGKRYIVAGHTYHLTHRCHDRAFLLKFKTDRARYRSMLRDRLKDFRISLFSYCITSNHVHLLLRPDPSGSLESLSAMMQCLEGDFAREYNRRKRRQNAFWGDRYHATMIESGEHLWRCLLYIDMNMVRAGVVKHPEDWEWTAYRELMGLRQRYRLIDADRLLEHVGVSEIARFRSQYARMIQEKIETGNRQREAQWTETLAVGSKDYVSHVSGQIRNRMQVTLEEEPGGYGAWVARESKAQYA